jgi:hypothetical protein
MIPCNIYDIVIVWFQQLYNPLNRGTIASYIPQSAKLILTSITHVG